MKILFAFLCIELLVGCSSPSSKHEKIDRKKYQPDFVQFFPRTRGMLYGLDSIAEKDANKAKDIGDQKARRDVRNRFSHKTVNAVMAALVKAEADPEDAEKFLETLRELLDSVVYPEIRIDQREYVDGVMFVLAKCEYTPEIISRIKEVITRAFEEHSGFYIWSEENDLVDDINSRIDLLEEY